MTDAEYDPAYRDRLTDDDEVHVDYVADPNRDGSRLIITRTVWRKAYQRRHRDILWQEVVLDMPRDGVADLVKDIVTSLAV